MLGILGITLRQHRTIASADISGSFAPILQFEKLEIHKVFLRFPNFILEQNLSLLSLAELCGAALKISTIPTVLPRSSSLCPPLPPPPFGQIQHRKAVCFPRCQCCLQRVTPSDAQRPADLLRNRNFAQIVHPADDACCFPIFAHPP